MRRGRKRAPSRCSASTACGEVDCRWFNILGRRSSGQMPLDLAFRDETGRDVRFGDYFGHKPVLLALVYYGCPMLCNQVEQGVVGSLKMLSFNAGRDFDVVFVSFDPRETPSMAAQKKVSALSHYGRPDTAAGWHFLTGTKQSIDSITSAANFASVKDASASAGSIL